MKNPVAKHMSTFNRPSVELDKRSKHLQDAYEKEMEGEWDDEDEQQYRNGACHE